MSRSVSHDAELGLLQQRLGPWYSLAPHRNHATPLDQLCSQLIDDTIDSSLARVFAQGIAQTAQALAAHFPENIFADIDFLAAALLAQTQAHSQSADSELNRHQVPRDLAELFDRITALIQLYGCHSAIGFRYVHDFLYGFDWARWVRKDPDRRSSIGPFDLDFLHYLHLRGTEILALIARGDRKYPPLSPGEWRNPFAFSRTPADEALLFQKLAAEDLLPLAAWDPLAQPSFDKDFYQLRQQHATQLNG